MFDRLYNFPEALVLAMSAAILVLAVVFLPRAIRRLPLLAHSHVNNDFALRAQTTLFTMTSLVVAFTLVQVAINFRQAEALVQAEASHIDSLDRLLMRYDTPESAAARPHLIVYAKSIIVDDWHAMRAERGSDKTRALYTPVVRHVMAIDPASPRQTQIFAGMLKTVDMVSEMRDRRLHAVTVELPTVYWLVVIFSVLMAILVSATIEPTPFRTTILAIQAAVLGAFIGFVFLMDQPFKGQTAADPHAIVQAISRMEARTE